MDGEHMMHDACCTPNTTANEPETNAAALDASHVGTGSQQHTIEQAKVPAQTFSMGDGRGDERFGDGEGPVHQVSLNAFEIDTTSVTNEQFERFIGATGYRTEAERFGFSAVFYQLVHQADRAAIIGAPTTAPWWLGIQGADWAHPHGPRTSSNRLPDHPAVHVSWNDAAAYCDWTGRRLPTEAEWECSSRGGLSGARYPWGDNLGEERRCNIWQGVFPHKNTSADGWLATAPVHMFKPNAYGLWQTVGNVWEWCADWWHPGYYATSPLRNPTGSSSGQGRILRGGSYLCHDSYCNRYRNSARSSNTPDSSMSNAGFRTVNVNFSPGSILVG